MRRARYILFFILTIVAIYVVALLALRGPVTTMRMFVHGNVNIRSYTIFPQRAVQTSPTPSPLQTRLRSNWPKTVTYPIYPYSGGTATERWDDLFARTNTRAFIVIKDDQVIYETYPNGGRRDAISPSFSVTKSFVSTLIGLAIEDGAIGSVNDAVIKYLPELAGRGLDALTLRHLLTMSSGVDYDAVSTVSPLLIPFSDDPRVFYTDNARRVGLSVRAGSEPVGRYFRYNDYYLLLEGLLLERVTGRPLAQYLQEKIWQPLGMEYPASWTLDSASSGFEKPEAGLNARAIDFARFGLLYLHHGLWNGKQIIPQHWITEATSPDANDQRPWRTFPVWPKTGGFYKYHWWGRTNADGSVDFMARGNLGQIIYVSPSRRAVVVRFGEGPQPDSLWPFAIRALLEGEAK